MPEEEAFAVLVQIMQQHRMRDMFKPSMAELGVCMYQLENLVQEQFPDLHLHFQSQTFQTSMYASRWFLTLYTTSLNLQISCRVMDIFLSEGMEFIFKMALAMLAVGKESLLCLDMEAMLKVSVIECVCVFVWKRQNKIKLLIFLLLLLSHFITLFLSSFLLLLYSVSFELETLS